MARHGGIKKGSHRSAASLAASKAKRTLNPKKRSKNKVARARKKKLL